MKTSGRLWQYYKDEPIDNIAESDSFKFKGRITENIPDDDNKKMLK